MINNKARMSPLSTLFKIMLDTLVNTIGQAKETKGFKLGKAKRKISVCKWYDHLCRKSRSLKTKLFVVKKKWLQQGCRTQD